MAAAATAAAASSHVELLPLTCATTCARMLHCSRTAYRASSRNFAYTGDRHVLVYNNARQAFVKNYE